MKLKVWTREKFSLFAQHQKLFTENARAAAAAAAIAKKREKKNISNQTTKMRILLLFQLSFSLSLSLSHDISFGSCVIVNLSSCSSEIEPKMIFLEHHLIIEGSFAFEAHDRFMSERC